MSNQIDLDKIKKIVKEFFDKTTFDIEVEINPVRGKTSLTSATPSAGTSNGVKKSPGETILIDLKMEDPQILIGERGETLREIQHLLKMILYKKFGELILIDLDINDYRKKKMEYLKELAKTSAEEVMLTKTEKILFPMSAYERRIIHMELAEHPNVQTESIGEEPERKVVIKPRI